MGQSLAVISYPLETVAVPLKMEWRAYRSSSVLVLGATMLTKVEVNFDGTHFK
jgi:hypothetical protein